MQNDELETIEIQLLLEGVYRYHGFDFRDYALAPLKRRIWNTVHSEGVSSISALQERVLHNAACMERFLLNLSVHVTAMFRDPGFYRAFRTAVVPLLRTYPFIRIWHTGCSTGEEVYSMAILLQEEGIYDRCRIYATDQTEALLRTARSGVFPLIRMQEYTANYLKAGGKRAFSEYYTAGYGNAIFNPLLRENVVFSQHNLTMDGSFNEFHVILCRNVMLYFNKALQKRAHALLYESLVIFGVLGLGHQETIKFNPYEDRYEELVRGEKLYRRIA
jgi:chemotaxis protein methyltransferase CheR